MIQCNPVRGPLWLALCLAIFTTQPLHAQTRADHSKDEAAIRQASKEYLQLCTKGDAKAIADCWTAAGTYTDLAGRTVKVRDLKPTSETDSPRPTAGTAPTNVKVRFVANDVAIEEGEFNLPAPDDGNPAKATYIALWVRDAGHWKLDKVQEYPVPSIGNADKVAALEAFVGDWIAEENKIAIQISAKWDANKKFLSRHISMTSGKAEQIGTQTIGWDPLSGQIRSWMFCDDGSFSEGVWSLEGNAWMAASVRGLCDGTTSEATQIFKFPDKNTMVWKVIRATVNGQPADDFQIVFKRSPSKK